MTEATRRRILDPAPGSALARARDYGIDLTLVLEAVRRTPDEQLARISQMQAMARAVTAIREVRNHHG